MYMSPLSNKEASLPRLNPSYPYRNKLLVQSSPLRYLCKMQIHHTTRDGRAREADSVISETKQEQKIMKGKSWLVLNGRT